MTTKHRQLLTWQEVSDLHNALDVLCGCYADGPNSPFVQELLDRYGKDSPDRKRAMALFRRVQAISRVSTADINPTT